jgi:hypothetical protein
MEMQKTLNSQNIYIENKFVILKLLYGNQGRR